MSQRLVVIAGTMIRTSLGKKKSQIFAWNHFSLVSMVSRVCGVLRLCMCRQFLSEHNADKVAGLHRKDDPSCMWRKPCEPGHAVFSGLNPQRWTSCLQCTVSCGNKTKKCEVVCCGIIFEGKRWSRPTEKNKKSPHTGKPIGTGEFFDDVEKISDGEFLMMMRMTGIKVCIQF